MCQSVGSVMALTSVVKVLISVSKTARPHENDQRTVQYCSTTLKYFAVELSTSTKDASSCGDCCDRICDQRRDVGRAGSHNINVAHQGRTKKVRVHKWNLDFWPIPQYVQ